MSTIPSQGVSLARQGLQEIGKARDTEGRRAAGDRFLQSIGDDAQSTELEKLLARTARAAASTRLYSGTSALNAHRAALDAVAGGVGGPSGQVLAQLAGTIMAGGYNNDDRRALARPMLEALAQSGQPLEREVATVALQATSLELYSGTTAVNAQTAAFGLVQAGIGASPESTIAGYGRQIMKSAYNNDDRWKVGASVLDHLAAGAAPETKTLAETAGRTSRLQLYSRTSAVAMQEKALDLIAAAPADDPQASLIALGQHALAHGYNADDKNLLGRAVLADLSTHAHDASVAAVAGAVTRAVDQQLYSNTSKVNLQTAAFNHLAGGLGTEPLPNLLAKLGAECHTAGYNTQDKALMGAAVLGEIAARGGDRRIDMQVSYGRQALADCGDDNARMQIQKSIFDNIVSGRNTVSVPLKGTNQSLLIPLIDETTPDDKAKAELEQCVPHNREVIKAIERLEHQHTSSIPSLQADLQKILDEEAALKAVNGPLNKRVQTLARAQGVAGLATVGGFLGAIAGHSLIALGIAAAGLAAWSALGKKLRAAVRERNENYRHDQSSSFTRIMAQVNLETAKSGAAACKAALAQAEPLHKPLDDRFRLLDMQAFVQGTMPDPNAKVEMEEQTVVIGGLRVPRNVTVTPPSEAALVTPPVEEAGEKA